MKVLIAQDTDAKYQCTCGCEFWVDASTEENLIFIDGELRPQCPDCDLIHFRNTTSIWLRVVAFPLWVFFIFIHFTICSILTIVIHPERKRYKFYEYYSPWGWGERKDCPYGKPQGNDGGGREPPS